LLASRFVSLLLALVALAAGADAQKLARKYFEDERNGFRVKPLSEFTIVPPRPEEEVRGMIAKMSGKELYILTEQGYGVNYTPGLDILRFEDKLNKKEDEDENRSRSTKRKDLGEYLDKLYKGLKPDKPVLDEQKKIKKLMARHLRFEARTPSLNIKQFVDVWTFELRDADIHLVYTIHEDKAKKYLKAFEKSAKTFSEIERKERAPSDDLSSYAAKLAYHQEDAERIPGWRALPVKSEKYIIKTSSDNRKFINEVISRLEASRKLYEKDFPPPPTFDYVSIVRVCGSEEEFHEYGNTSPGVAGWFNPGSTELVLFDAVNINRNMTYAVMSHEAFHQYCHFLFEQSEAHRWFDEGHGDYYGAVEFRGKKAKVTTKMPAGLDRLSVIKEMVRSQTYIPIEEHINYSHGEWQNQGPSRVSGYAQSWSIIYMLRQGTLGNLNKKIWKKEYGRIIPAYVETLYKGFADAYAEVLGEREKQAEEEERELTEEEKKHGRQFLDPDKKREIWKKAIEASWGRVDVGEFEENWVTFVNDFL